MATKTRKRLAAITVGVLVFVCDATTVLLQTRTYPKEIRGYKVERTVVEVKKPETKNRQTGNDQSPRENNNSDGPRNAETNSEADVDELIQLGKPQLARVTPLGITFEVPIVVSPVKQSVYIYLPSALLAALGDWSDTKETWPVTGRVYVFGKFKRSIFSFKRVVPVELNLSMRNPLRER